MSFATVPAAVTQDLKYVRSISLPLMKTQVVRHKQEPEWVITMLTGFAWLTLNGQCITDYHMFYKFVGQLCQRAC